MLQTRSGVESNYAETWLQSLENREYLPDDIRQIQEEPRISKKLGTLLLGAELPDDVGGEAVKECS